MAFCLWYLAPFSWLKAKIDGNVERKEAEWKRQEKKAKRNQRRKINAMKNSGRKRGQDRAKLVQSQVVEQNGPKVLALSKNLPKHIVLIHWEIQD